jgi:hypothetical protein
MKVKPIIIETFALYRVGRVLFNDAIRVATTLIDHDIPGTEKQKIAFEALKDAAKVLGAATVNIAIELAVDWLTAKGLIK